MTRGKHATLSEGRANRAAMELIDRLTAQVAELKVRTKMVEADAMAAAGLRREVARLKTDPVVAELVEKIGDAFRSRESQYQAWLQAKPELFLLIGDAMMSLGLLKTRRDGEEFMLRRYPHLFAFLDGRDIAEVLGTWRSRSRHARRLSPEAARRLEMAVGERASTSGTWAEGRDFADTAIDVADVVRMELTVEERKELLGIPSTTHRKPSVRVAPR